MTVIKRLNWIYLLVLLVMSFTSYGQIKFCGDFESFHPVDQEIIKLREHLQTDGIDTIIMYSHWIYTNGFNGYGKVLWKTDGEIFQLRLNYDKETSRITMTDTMQVLNDSIVNFFFDEQLDSIKNNPEKQDIQMSHDGRHFISINWGENQYCYTISNLLVQFNPDNKRVQWINYFKEEGTDSIYIDGVRIESSSKTKRRKKK